MKIRTFFAMVVIGMLLVSCSSEKPLNEYLINSWETTYLKIDMPTFQRSDSTTVFEDKFLNNPTRRARSKYNNDGTFKAWFVNQKDEKSGETTGTWNVKNDSLYIEYFYGGRDVKVAYQIERTKEGFVGTSKYDWDEDGDFDDLLLMKTKQIDDKN